MWHSQDEKLLVASFGFGEQAPHMDRDDVGAHLRLVFTVILYLEDGCDSTAFPRFPKRALAVPEFDESDPFAYEALNARAMQASVAAGLLEDGQNERWPARRGDMAIFPQTTMHLGTRNANPATRRRALFGVFTPFDDERQDDYQTFRWMYQAYAYGVDARELAQALWRDRDHDPMNRFGDNPAGRQSFEAYLRCLLRWGVARYHPRRPKGARVEWLAAERHLAPHAAPLGDDAVNALALGPATVPPASRKRKAGV